MSARRPHRIDRKTAERLLRGEPVDTGAGLDGLVHLFAAAAGPARDGELSGEQAAMAAFRKVQTVPAKQRRPSMMKSALAKLLSAKILASAAAATAASGVVLAASTGHLPDSLGGGSSTPTPHPTPHVTGQPAGDQADADSHGAKGTPSPSLQGLCQAYHAGVADNPGKALDNPAFSVLISTAGGKDKVGDYCATVLDDKGGKASSHPTGASEGHPTGRPEDGGESGHPTGAPSTHPGGDATTARPTPSHPGGSDD